MDRTRPHDSPATALGVAIAAAAVVAWAAIRWTAGLSMFGFESPYWDLGLLPILTALLAAALRLKTATGRWRRFLVGVLVCGLSTAAVYAACCTFPAPWNPASVLQPFQTGYMLAQGKTTWRALGAWGVFVDTTILVLIPVLPALLGGLAASVRLTLHRTMAAVAVVAVLLGGFVSTKRSARYKEQMGYYHLRQIVGGVGIHSTSTSDGKFTLEVRAVDRGGNPPSTRQQRLNRWHAAMAEKYWRSANYPWSPPVKETPPPE